MYKLPLPFGRFCCDPAPVCSIQPHHQPPCPWHLSSAHASSLLARVFLFSPRDCNGEVETGYSSQVAAPPFGGAGWTARTCVPEPALLIAQPAVTKASSRAISMPDLSRAVLEQMHTLFGYPCAWSTRQHQQKDKETWMGPLEREGTANHGSASFLNMTESPKATDGLVLCKQLQKLKRFLPHPQGSGALVLPACMQPGKGLSSGGITAAGQQGAPP